MKRLLFLFTLLFITVAVWGQTNYYVATTGNNSNDGLTSANAWLTIQHAIDNVAAGSIINVAAGVYSENSKTWVDIELFKSLTLKGAGSGQTTVEFTGKQHGLAVRPDATGNVTIEGFTFTKPSSATKSAEWGIIIGETGGTFNNLILKDVEVAYASARNVALKDATYYNIIIEDCNIHHSWNWGLSTRGTITTMSVINSSFTNNGWDDQSQTSLHGIGFDIDMPTIVNSLTVTGGTFSDNSAKGINLVKTSNATFTNITANNNGGHPQAGFGVSLWEWDGTSSNHHFEEVTLSGNSLDGFLIGSETGKTVSNISITESHLANNGRGGLYVYRAAGWGDGIIQNVSVNNSQITGNGTQVGVVLPYEPVDATCNWWGSANPDFSTLVSGSVDYSPWLVTDDLTDPECYGGLPNVFLDESFDDPVPVSEQNLNQFWYPDRYPPAAFESYSFNTENVLRIETGPGANDRGSKSGTFYNTHGRKFNQEGLGAKSMRGDLYIPQDWSTNHRRTDLWATMQDDQNNITSYPIVGYRNVDGQSPTFSYWNSAWFDVPNTIKYDDWNTFEFKLHEGVFYYYINGEKVATVENLQSQNSHEIRNIIVQIYSFDDPSLTNGQYDAGNSYEAYWDNIITTAGGPIHNINQGTYFAQIQSAINAANPNDVIEVAAGLYEETIDINVENLTLESLDGAEKTTIKGAGSSGASNATVRITANGIKFNGFTVDNEGAAGGCVSGGNLAENVTIKNNIFANSQRGVRGDFHGKFSTGLTIKDNIFDGVTRGVTNSEDWGSVSVINNQFKNIGANAISFGTGITNVTITGNSFENVVGRHIANYETTSNFDLNDAFTQNTFDKAAVCNDVSTNIVEAIYSTITKAVEEASPGATIEVAAGTYVEDVEITNKEVSIIGVIDNGSLPLLEGSISIDYNNLSNPNPTTIKNMSFFYTEPSSGHYNSIYLRNAQNITIEDCHFDGAGRFMQQPYSQSAVNMNQSDNITLDGCHVENGYYMAIYAIAGGNHDLTVKNSVFENIKSGINLNTGDNLVVEYTDISIVAQGDDQNSYCVRNSTNSTSSYAENMTITGCTFTVDKAGFNAETNIYHAAVVIRSEAIGNLKVERSALFGDVVNLSSTNLDATCNWWGTTAATTIATMVDGPVDVTTVLDSDDLVNANCITATQNNVTNVTQSKTYNTIQAAIDDANVNDVIEVDEGTYVETININVAGIQLRGAQYGVDARERSGNNESIICDDANDILTVGAPDVTLDGFTIIHPKDHSYTGANDRIGITAGSSGVTIENNILGRRVFPGSSVEDLTITKNWFRNIDVSANKSAIYHENDALNLSITDNLFTDINYSAMILTSVNIDGHTNTQITGNKIQNTGSQAINIAGPKQTDLTIEDNEIIGAGQNMERGAIRLYATVEYDNVSIKRNELKESAVGLQVRSGTPHTTFSSIAIGGTGDENIFIDNVIQVKDEAEAFDLDDILADNTFDRAVVVRDNPIKVPVIFSSIQDAIDHDDTDPGDVIEVAAGVYVENLLIETNNIRLTTDGNNPATIKYEDNTTSSVVDIRGNGVVLENFNIERNNGVSGSQAINIRRSDIVVQGLTITGSGNIHGPNVIPGIHLTTGDPGTYNISLEGVLIKDNHISGEFCYGIAVTTYTDAYIKAGIIDNTFVDLTYNWGGTVYDGYGLFIADTEHVSFGGSIDLSISGNSFYDVHGIYMPANDPAVGNFNIGVNYNSFVGLGKWGIRNYSDFLIDATLNWWGHADGPCAPDDHSDCTDYGDKVSDNVLYIPWYCSEDMEMDDICAPGNVVNLTTNEVYNNFGQAIADAVQCTTYTEHTIFVLGPIPGDTINAAGKTITIIGVRGKSTLTGASPALVVDDGDVVAIDITFSTTTDDHTIVVTGGSLKLRNCVIEGTSSTTSPPYAGIYYTGGTVDAGTATDHGLNRFVMHALASNDYPAIYHAGDNGDQNTVIEAIGNDWGHTSGPLVENTSSNNNAGLGAVINGDNGQDEHVNYEPWGGPITTIATVTVCENENALVDIIVEGFDNVGVISLTLGYDPAELGAPTIYSSMGDFMDPSNGWNPVFNADDGEITISAHNNASPFTFGSDVLLTLEFEVLTSVYSAEIWFNNDDEENNEYADGSHQGNIVYLDKPYEHYYIDGGVVINRLQTSCDISKDQVICAKTEVDELVGNEAEGKPGTPTSVIEYQWQYSINGDEATPTWDDITDADKKDYTPSDQLEVDTWFRRVVTSTLNGEVCTYYSNVVKITVNKRIPIAGEFFYPYRFGDLNLDTDDIEIKLWDIGEEKYIKTLTTIVKGVYEFPVVYDDYDYCPGKEYELHILGLNDLPYGGINTTDAAMVHYWGTNVYQIEKVKFMGGDVTYSGNIGASDASDIQQYFVKNITLFDRSDEMGSRWVFHTIGETIDANPTDPTTMFYPAINLEIDNSEDNEYVLDIYGLVTGDFNGSFNPTAKSSESLDMQYNGSLVVGTGQEFDLPVRIQDAATVGAVSLILDVPAKYFEVMDVEIVSGGNLEWSISGNELRVSWYSMFPLSLIPNDELLTLKLRTTPGFINGVNTGISLVSDPLNELANEYFDVIEDAVILIEGIDAAVAIDDLYGNRELVLGSRPNPFRDQAVITYGLPFAGEVTLDVYNIMGMKVASLEDGFHIAGYHTSSLIDQTLKQGAYTVVLTLKGENETLVKTMKLIRF